SPSCQRSCPGVPLPASAISWLWEVSHYLALLQELYYRNFQHFENLQKLSFQNNNISYIEMGAFRSLTRLRQLHLQNNHLLNLHNGVFSMLQHLEVLNLEGNRIKTIAPVVFTSLNPFGKVSKIETPKPNETSV
uniref:Uncharacterized protein n=1 Tax=Gopherus evgoodei TaxID=1825980 RepID=A0A8C4YEC3_9SAUR